MKALIRCFMFCSIILVSCNYSVELQNSENIAIPSPFGPSDEDDPNRDSLKQLYYDQLYYATEGTNIDSIHNANWQRHQDIKKSRLAQGYQKNTVESFMNGDLMAQWHERGPNNEAGDMRILDYVPSTDALLGISTANHLWKGSIAGNDWVLLDDDIKYNKAILAAFDYNGGHRILTTFGSGEEKKVIRYSDDDGETWTLASGLDYYDHWGGAKRVVKMDNGTTVYYLVQTWSGNPWGSQVQLHKSNDKGETFTSVYIPTDVGYGGDDFSIVKAPDADILFLIDNKHKNVYRITHNMDGTSTIGTAVSYAAEGVPNGKLDITCRYNTTESKYEIFVNVDSDNSLYSFLEGDTDWTNHATPSSTVWNRGFLVNPSTGELYVGGFQLNKSDDYETWEAQYAQWWEYYGTSKDSMHVDIMNLQYFEKADNTPFILICNHAGVHVTYDDFHTTANLGLSNLRVTTLYDQTTASDGFVYCGAQDKGTFTYDGNSLANYDLFDTDNRSTGDGMIGEFFNNDASIAMMLQNGSFYAYANKSTSGLRGYGQIPGNHRPGWINPIKSTPDPTDSRVYIAGGNLNGGDGSYLITMDMVVSGSNVTFNPSQFNYDFRANSNNGTSVIKAIGTSESDSDRLYIATQDATFFYSTDGGTSWTKSSATLPSSMIPWDIITSETDADVVYISGTGNSNTGVYKSIDGGVSFTALDTDIPSATIYEIALAEDNDLLYAATSAGPYVFNLQDNTWYPLIGGDTPLVDFNTVDNIGNNTIRFGTYGRGIWDLEVTSAPLPVELVRFEAELQDNNEVLLDWSTSVESNVQNFEIEHSVNSQDFVQLGRKEAKGNSNSLTTYQWIDDNAVIGTNYYRLKINDKDGTFEFSDIRIIEVNSMTKLWNVYPNPVALGDNVTITGNQSEKFELQVFDATGRLVFSKANIEGKTEWNPSLARGSYFYKIIANGKVQDGSLIIQ